MIEAAMVRSIATVVISPAYVVHCRAGVYVYIVGEEWSRTAPQLNVMIVLLACAQQDETYTLLRVCSRDRGRGFAVDVRQKATPVF